MVVRCALARDGNLDTSDIIVHDLFYGVETIGEAFSLGWRVMARCAGAAKMAQARNQAESAVTGETWIRKRWSARAAEISRCRGSKADCGVPGAAIEGLWSCLNRRRVHARCLRESNNGHRRNMPTVDTKNKRIIQRADKYVRQKQYTCLFPGCNKKAINSHSVPRASCVEALSQNGVLYSRRQSFNQMMTMTATTDPPDVVEIGARNAGTFKGYCPEHDRWLFFSAETDLPHRKNGMLISLHLRALSLEYCRKRKSRDFSGKLSELVDDPTSRARFHEVATGFDAMCTLMKDAYLASTFALIGGSNIDSVQSYSLAFGRNLQVSCCGCFNEQSNSPLSVIAFNLISNSDISFLALTTFKAVEQHLKSFQAKYVIPNEAGRLVNDIAFLKCEEPLISAKLWRSLTENEKVEVRLCLRHPASRPMTLPPK